MQEWPLPVFGVSRIITVEKEPAKYSGYMNNIRPTDVLESKIRLGQRPGLDKWSSTQIGSAENPVVALCCVNSVV
uniref:Uncharacterized protein n=1 Tax=viral metagenome TaxID=1070528 RepID=A0A6M3J059_9ZZZZ